MSKPVDRVKEDALDLPPSERAELAHLLIESLGSEDDPAVTDDALAHEIERRAERAEILEEIAIAEQQIARGEMVDHETARATLLRRIRA